MIEDTRRLIFSWCVGLGTAAVLVGPVVRPMLKESGPYAVAASLGVGLASTLLAITVYEDDELYR